jgi:hypothetical protein
VTRRATALRHPDLNVARSDAMALFENRREAGRRLAQRLRALRDEQPVVLALPRGGLPVVFDEAARVAAAWFSLYLPHAAPLPRVV